MARFADKNLANPATKVFLRGMGTGGRSHWKWRRYLKQEGMTQHRMCRRRCLKSWADNIRPSHTGSCMPGRLEHSKLVCNEEGFRNLHEGRDQPDEISESPSMAFLLLFPVATSLPFFDWPSC